MIEQIGGQGSILEACASSKGAFDMYISFMNYTLYETDGSFERENIKTKIYVKLKNHIWTGRYGLARA
mgnify:CR=1 FL=1